jgi:hypothetical protein
MTETNRYTPELTGLNINQLLDAIDDNSPTHPIEAAMVEVRADHDLNAVELEVHGQTGAESTTLLAPDAALDLLARVLRAVAELLGRDDEHARGFEGVRLIETLCRLGIDQKHIAEGLGVSDTAVSMWKRNKAIPSARRLAQLRHLLSGAL